MCFWSTLALPGAAEYPGNTMTLCWASTVVAHMVPQTSVLNFSEPLTHPFSPLQVMAWALQRCPGHRHFPATPQSRAKSTSSPFRWPAATPSATARASCNDSRGQPAKRDSQAWNLPPGPGSSACPPHPQLAMKTEAYQLQPDHRIDGNLERRLP